MMDKTHEEPHVQLSNDDLDLLDHLLAEEGVGAAHSGRPVTRPDHLPLSFSQELLWMLDRAAPGLTAYNMPIARRLSGVLDLTALERAIALVVARHETLRTRFVSVEGGEPAQVVDPAGAISLRVIDLTSVAHAEREAEATRIVRERARTPFDMSREPLFRTTLVRLGPADNVLLIETHHIVFDGWSAGIFFDDLSVAYGAYTRGETPTLPHLAMQYADYALWQREQLAGERLAALLAYWRGQLGDAMEPLSVPTDFPRAAAPGFTGARRSRLLPASLLTEVKRLGQRHDATLYMTLLAAYMTVLHRYTGRANVLVGSGIAGRTESETERLIGYFNNTLVQRGDFCGDPTFAALLEQVRERSLDAYDHQDVPLEKLVLELREGQDRFGNAPLFEVVFTMQNTIATTSMLGDIELSPFGVDLGATKFDLTLLTTERDEGLWLALQYRSDLFDGATIDRLLGHLQTILEAAVRDASQPVSVMALLTAEEERQLATWNETDVAEGAATTMTALIEAVAARVPTRTAVFDGGRSLTYAQLNAQANQLARTLQASGVTAAPIGLCLDRSIEAIVGLLAILKSGGAYVPLPPDLPPARIAQRIEESGLRVVVTMSTHAELLPADVTTVQLDRDGPALASARSENLNVAVEPDALAYILYTSGSTGIPKGVGVRHRNIVHYTRAVSRILRDVPVQVPGDQGVSLDDWTFGLVSTLGADLGNTSIFPALCGGGTLHILPPTAAVEPAGFAEYLQAHPLDVLKITPNHLRALVAGRRGAELSAVLPTRWLVLGGEALELAFSDQLLAAGQCRILNHYGPTEATVGACTWEVTPAASAEARAAGSPTAPIGLPMANTHAHVLDAHQRPVPIGIPGELCLGGAGIASGYVNQPALTAERFVVYRGAEGANEVVYRTGDRVRRHPSGVLEFLGRIDDQVKIRGYRVELGEIEHELAQHPALAQCVVVARDIQDENGTSTELRLVAYVVPRASGYATAHAEPLTPQRLLEWLRDRVPEHMLPGAVIVLDELPLNANGKVDKRRLPEADLLDAQRSDTFVAPRSETEIALSTMWAEVLKKERVGITDNFFSLGGHSLLAIRVLGKLSRQFGVRLPLRTLFDAPTVEQLAQVVERERPSGASAPTDGITPRARDAHRIRTTPANGSTTDPAGFGGGS